MGGPFLAHAAARRRRQQLAREEEMMTPYTPQDLEGWEFKIIRGPFRESRIPGSGPGRGSPGRLGAGAGEI